jgi:hypothetical protein
MRTAIPRSAKIQFHEKRNEVIRSQVLSDSDTGSTADSMSVFLQLDFQFSDCRSSEHRNKCSAMPDRRNVDREFGTRFPSSLSVSGSHPVTLLRLRWEGPYRQCSEADHPRRHQRRARLDILCTDSGFLVHNHFVPGRRIPRECHIVHGTLIFLIRHSYLLR